MILHRVAHDVGDFYKTPVIKGLHRMHDAALNRLEAIIYVRHGTLQNHIRRIVEKPATIHPAQPEPCSFSAYRRRKVHSLLLNGFRRLIGIG